jgi:lipoprotein NlpI
MGPSNMKHTCLILVLMIGPFTGILYAAGEGSEKEIIMVALQAFVSGDSEKALELAGDAIRETPENPQVHQFRGHLYSQLRRHTEAVMDYGNLLDLDPDPVLRAKIHQARGESYFKLGKFKESITDFDAFLELRPEEDPHHWQRGISYYYASEYEKGHKQFERHQAVNSHDVENAVWHFLCKARATDLKTAREALIPISGDQRIPMMEIHALFAGNSTPEKVMAKAEAGEMDQAQCDRQVFYANLYLGLWFEAAGDAKRSWEHIVKAAKSAEENGYMGDVAMVHNQKNISNVVVNLTYDPTNGTNNGGKYRVRQ